LISGVISRNVPLQAVKDVIARATSPLVRRFAEQLIAAASGRPILDVACGSGRNAFFLAGLGATVICIDKDLSSFAANLRQRCGSLTTLSNLLLPKKIDLVRDEWPFTPGSIGAIINVHFLMPALFPHFASSLAPNGFLLLETVSGHGENYLELPQKGELKAALGDAFDFASYQERSVGPSDHHAVVVKLLARRKG
jgi:SAM-dependent methyltransferase